mmetsp:Transcript_24330/g.56072  ORF Transcript_24330/g.56072 Transcript_24330/m.56072 type:complete len:228 (+) Transcript_24330:2836-3519(+)
MVLASSKDQLAGFCVIRAAKPVWKVLRQPGHSPKISSPTLKWLTRSPNSKTVPEQSAPGGPGSPGYKPITFNTSRKFSPTARIRSCTNPGITGRRFTCGTAFRFVKAPRAGMFKRIGPRTFVGLLVNLDIRTNSSPHATSSSLADFNAAMVALAADGTSRVALELASKVHTCTAPGYSMRIERAKPHRPECLAEPAFRSSKLSVAKTWVPWVTITNIGTLLMSATIA